MEKEALSRRKKNFIPQNINKVYPSSSIWPFVH